MKKLFENWNRFLNEEVTDTHRQAADAVLNNKKAHAELLNLLNTDKELFDEKVEELSFANRGADPIDLDVVADMVEKELRSQTQGMNEKKLTPAEYNKKKEIADAIKRDNPDMPDDERYAIATDSAKKSAE